MEGCSEFNELMIDNDKKTEASIKKEVVFSMKEACNSNNLMTNLRLVVESHPDETAKNLGMSIMHLLDNRYDKTLECLEYLNENYPEIGLINRRIAEIHISRSDYKTAVSYLKKALKSDEEDLTAKFWLGLSYYAIGDEKKAKTYLNLLKRDVFILQASKEEWLEQE